MKTRLLTSLITTLLTTIVISASAQNLTNGLIAYYPFDGNANDVSGNGNHATPAGNYQFITNGLSGGALRAVGDNSLYYAAGGHVLLPTFGSYLNSGFTFSLWVKDEVIGGWPVNTETYFAFGSLSQTRAEIWLNSTFQGVAWAFDDSSGTGIETNKPATDLGQNWAQFLSSWKHLVFTYAEGKMSGYFDGQKRVEVSRSYNIFPVSKAALNRHWWDSGASSSARMSCTYDNVRIYNRALSDDEVRQLYLTERNPLPYLTIGVKTLRLTLHLELGKTYQLRSSTDNQIWSPHGSPFLAVVSPVTQDVEVTESARFFQVKEVVGP